MEIVDVEECQPDPIAVTRKKSLWAKINNRTTYGYLFNIVISILLLTCLVLVLYFFKEYLRTILFWVNHQDPWIIFALFLGLFLIVSFPVTIGYLVLIITSGYLFGILNGLGTVLVCANFGVAVAHYTLRALRSYLPLERLMKNETARALLKVIAGPQAFKIVFFARLTPIPFGLQNTIFAGVSLPIAEHLQLLGLNLSLNLNFGEYIDSIAQCAAKKLLTHGLDFCIPVSDIRGCGYHIATLLGLFPAQLINVYLGSTLRSIHEVLDDSHVTGYIVFAFQILIGITLMVWVVQKARKELTIAIMAAESISTSSSSSIS